MRTLLLFIGGIMAFQLIGSGSDLNSVISQTNANILELKNQETTKIVKDDTGTRRVLSGKGADDFYGFKVSQPGIDVYTATDDQLIFNSGQNVFKIIGDPITLTLNIVTGAAATSGEVSQAHGLSYTPAYIAYITVDDAFYGTTPVGLANGPNPTVMMYTTGGLSLVTTGYFAVTVDATNINFSGQVAINSGTITNTAKVYLLQETFN